jgi:hypothetical protein
MDTIKTISITTFFIVLLASNLGIFVEGLLVIFPSSIGYSFAGNTTEKTADLEIGTLAIAADKMNVFYVGVENPITVAASGIDSKNLSLKAEGATVKTTGNGHYSVLCSTPGQVNLTVTNNSTGKSKSVNFRVKRIPDPVIRMGRKTDGFMSSGEFRAQLGLMANLDNFDMDLNCTIQSYTLYYVCKRCDPIELQGSGNRFTGMISNVIRRATPGDQYVFTEIKVRCPGDRVGRRVNGLSFKIK